MNSIESATLFVTKNEQKAIADLISILDGLSITLSNDDYVDIFRAIADEDIQGSEHINIYISYEESIDEDRLFDF